MKIAIIGSGPAGLYSTILLKKHDADVTLFEQRPTLGEKLRLTGGGRMNVTNKDFGVEHFSSAQPRLLNNLFKSPWVQKREEVLAELGIRYKWEKNRAILETENAFAEVDRLFRSVQDQKNAETLTETTVTKIEKDEEKFIVSFRQNGEIKQQDFDIVILATGGRFRIQDNSNLDHIYALQTQLGHTITETSPSLSPLTVDNHPLVDLAGVSFTGTLTCPHSKKQVSDSILITHQGFSGPAVLDFSAYLEKSNFEVAFTASISESDFTSKLQSLRQGSNRLRKFLQEYMVNNIADWILYDLGLDKEVRVADLNKEKMKLIIAHVFHFPIPLAKTLNYPFCWTTKGGVALNEVNVATLESKLHKNLFFAGEVLDVNGLCGGYNISFAAICAKIVSEGIN